MQNGFFIHPNWLAENGKASEWEVLYIKWLLPILVWFRYCFVVVQLNTSRFVRSYFGELLEQNVLVATPIPILMKIVKMLSV